VEALRWRGATVWFAPFAERIGDARLGARVLEIESRLPEK
jgi:hypothetical protein